jgi:hypothetical protein
VHTDATYVDLVTLRRREVRLLVAMLDPKVLEKTADENGQLYIRVMVVLKMKGYDFFFHGQPDDFILDAEFVPYFWRPKGNDPDDEDAGKDKDNQGNDDPGRLAESHLVIMDVDAA